MSLAVLLMLAAAFFRLWKLGTVPPGMHADELINAQLADHLRAGELSVIYDQVSPAREGLYYVILAATSQILGRGLILWRVPSVWLAFLSLAMTARLMRRLFGVRVSLLVLGLMAVTFWPIWIGRTVERVALMPLMVTITVYAFARAFDSDSQRQSSLWFTLGGLALGISQYVHVTAWTLPLLFVIAVSYFGIVDRKGFRRHRANVFYALLLAVVICLPLFIYLGRHPGVREVVPIAEQPGLITQIPDRLLKAVSSLALRGDMLPEHNLPGRPVLGPFIASLMAIGLGVALVRFREPQYGFVIIWLLVGLLPSAFLPQQPNFEYMAVILPVVFVLPAVGLRAIYGVFRSHGGRLQGLLSGVVSLSVVVLLIGNSVWTYRDLFVRWPSLGDVRLNYQADLGILAHYLDVSQDTSPISICSTPVDTSSDPFALTNQELLSYLMHRHNLPVRYFDCTQSLVLADGGASQRIIFPREHYYDRLPGPLLVWMQGATDEHVPGIRPDVIMRVDWSSRLPDFFGVFTTMALASWPPEADVAGLVSLPASFGYNVTFLGYDLPRDVIQPGEWVDLISYWRIDGPPPPELLMFAHMLSQPEVIVAQRDTFGAQTSTLQVRDIVIQYSSIKTPDGLADGPYPLSVGLYLPSSGQRLEAYENDAPHADRLFIRSVVVSH